MGISRKRLVKTLKPKPKPKTFGMAMKTEKFIVQRGGRVDKESGKKKRIVGKYGKKAGLK